MLLGRAARWRVRLLLCFYTIVASAVLVKNIADVLWLGHDPLFVSGV